MDHFIIYLSDRWRFCVFAQLVKKNKLEESKRFDFWLRRYAGDLCVLNIYCITNAMKAGTETRINFLPEILLQKLRIWSCIT